MDSLCEMVWPITVRESYPEENGASMSEVFR
jgi:hypothetical protein